MKARPMLAVLATLLLVLSSLLTLPVSAYTPPDIEGDWTTYRSAAEYDLTQEEELNFTPAPGYEYDEEGLHLISPKYQNTTVFGTLQSKEVISLKDGFYMELRVDDFSYGGEDGTADNYISFHLWNRAKITPGATQYGQGWLSLIRHKDGVSAESFTSDTSFNYQGSTAIEPARDPNGKAIYTLEVTNDGTNYTVMVCGVPVEGGEAITTLLNSLNTDGEFYVGASFWSAVTNGTLSATLLKCGASKETATAPAGSDSKEPEDTGCGYPGFIDPDKVPQNHPAMVFDASGSSWTGDIPQEGLTLDRQGNNSFLVTAKDREGYFLWEVKRSLSYEAQDFPVIAILLEDQQGIVNDLTLRFSTGIHMTDTEDHSLRYHLSGITKATYGIDGEYTLAVIDLKEALSEDVYENHWSGRINNLRLDFHEMNMDPTSEEVYGNAFWLHWVAVFRSVDEAEAYANVYTWPIGPQQTEESATVPVEDPTEISTDVPGTDEGATEPQEETTVPDSKTERGCASVIGEIGLVPVIAVAFVQLKKRSV